MTEGMEVQASPRGFGWRALAIFGGVALLLALLYSASVLAFGDASVFLDPNGRFGLVRLVRFNAALGLLFSYLCASLWLGRRWAESDFGELRAVVEAGDAEWSAWTQQSRTPRAALLVRAAALGCAFGIGVDVISGRGSYAAPIWFGHEVWVHVLNPALFGVVGLLVQLSGARSSLYRELGRRARVTLGDVAPLAPFVRAGLRIALLWFVGTSLASLLLVDASSPAVVVSILFATAAIGVASLVAPSRGVHERLRAAKRQELAWLQPEIARASDALRRGDARDAAPLPALLAWEARVASAPEWPFDTATWLRFTLLLLVPVGSWLGGALVEQVVERWFGA